MQCNVTAAVLILSAWCWAGSAAAESGEAAPREMVGERSASSVNRAGRPMGEGRAFRLFILSGQSNMAALSERLFIIPHLIAAFPDDELLIVKDALSGQPIRRWYKDWKPGEGWHGKNSRDKPGNNDLYQKLMGMVREAVGERRPDTVCFLWMQGEADAKAGQAAQYEASLRGLIAQLRQDLGRPDVSVVIGRISDHQNGEAGWDTVRQGQVAAIAGDPLARWFDTDDINGDDNALHYMKGYKTLGERFAAHAVELTRKQVPK